MAKVRLSIWIVVIATVVAIAITAHNGFKGSSQIKPLSDTAIIIEQTPAEQSCIDSNEQEAKQIQQLDNNKQENKESDLIALLKQQERSKLEKLDVAIVELDNYVIARRKEIEEWYVSERERLKLWAEKCTKELDEHAKLAYVRCLQKMENTISSSVAVASTNTYGHAYTYYSPYGYANTSGYAYTGGVSRGITEKSVVGNPVEDYKLELESIKESQRSVEDVFSELIEMRKRYLWELESRAVRQRAVIEAQKRAVIKNTKVKLEGGPGLIDAISYSGKKPCIMFSGEILYEGDYANGFKIMKILPNCVEFEKNGTAFVQGL